MAADEARAERVRERYKVLKAEIPGFTWGKVAEHVGISERSVHGWAKTGGMDAKHLAKAAEALQVDEDWLWRGDRPATPDLSLADVRGEFRGDVDGVQAQLDRLEDKLDYLIATLPKPRAASAGRRPVPPARGALGRALQGQPPTEQNLDRKDGRDPGQPNSGA